jgi:hypothetical protein
MHSIEYGHCPSSFQNTWQKNHVRNQNVHLRNANDYHIPTAKIEFFKRIPLYCLPLEWNNLVDEIKFKKALKGHLLDGLIETI